MSGLPDVHASTVVGSISGVGPAVVKTPLAFGFGVYGDVALLIVGVVCLYLGAEALVEAASELAIGFGVSAAVIGVTVVAFGTTMPELFVGLSSAVDYTSTLGISAIIGSNIANIGLVLGVAAMVQPFSVDRTVLTRHAPFMILAMALLVGLGFDRTISRVDGIVLLLALGGFTVFIYRESTRGAVLPTEEVEVTGTTSRAALLNVALILAGVAVLYLGSRSLIVGGRNVLRTLGFGSRFIGLTVLALGTSLPELAASVVSAVRDKGAFSLGNVVGSNIYNILAVVGLIAVIVPVSVPANTVRVDFPALVLFSIGILVLLSYKRRLSRAKGGLLLGSYGAFIVILL